MKYKCFCKWMMVGVGCCGSVSALAQQTDPTLTAAVIGQTVSLEKSYSKREKIQKNILAAEAGVAIAMEQVHKVEKDILSYLSNVSDAVRNLHQIKRIAMLTGVEIPKNAENVAKAVPGHLKGTAIAAIVSKELTDVYEQMASLVPFVSQLVTSGSYNVSDGNGGKEKHKVNLLNAAERYYVINEIQSRLEMINVDLYLLAWQIQTWSWERLWFSLDPEGWATVMAGQNRVEMIIREWPLKRN